MSDNVNKDEGVRSSSSSLGFLEDELIDLALFLAELQRVRLHALLGEGQRAHFLLCPPQHQTGDHRVEPAHSNTTCTSCNTQHTHTFMYMYIHT